MTPYSAQNQSGFPNYQLLGLTQNSMKGIQRSLNPVIGDIRKVSSSSGRAIKIQRINHVPVQAEKAGSQSKLDLVEHKVLFQSFIRDPFL